MLNGAQAITCRPADLIAPEMDKLIAEVREKAQAEGVTLADHIEDVVRGDDEVQRVGIRSMTQALRQRLFAELGLPLPAAVVRRSSELPASSAVVSIFEIPSRLIQLPEGAEWAERMRGLEQHAAGLLRPRAADFMGIAETQSLLDQLEQIAPALCRQVVPKPISLSLLADILRRLLEERVSIRDLRSILEALATAPATDKDPLSLTELVRAQLRRATSHRLTLGSGALPVYLLDVEIEEAVRGAVQRTQAGSFLALAPAAARDIIHAVRAIVGSGLQAHGSPAVVLTQPDIRRFVRKLLESDFPELHVVSFAELMPEISLRPLGKATLRGM